MENLVLEKDELLLKLKLVKEKYQDEGLKLLGIMGSYARDEADEFSDVDVLYELNYELFSKRYKDGFSKLLRIDEIKKELELILNKKVDLVSKKEKFLNELVLSLIHI